jgi:hypothetical protein
MFKESLFGPIGNFPAAFFLILIVWSLFWKGLALWRVARDSRKYWFIAILLLNTVGILPIIYLAFFQKKLKSK